MLPVPISPAARRLRKLVRLGLAVAVLAAGLVWVHRPLLVGFAYLFRVDDPAPSDAIVLLMGDPKGRTRHAAELWREGLAPLVVLSQSADHSDLGLPDETETTRRILEHGGVPANRIVVLPDVVRSTRDEAQAARTYIESHPMCRITVVSSAFHTARARWIFRRALKGLDIDVRMAAVDDPELDETNWYRRDEGLVTYFTEALKTVYYWLVY
jgi:uncharacterized SAM-binding protein YcdF (DUF218 family)